MLRSWSVWGLLLCALLFNSLYTSFSGQRQVNLNPRLRTIELCYASRQQRWSLIAILIVLGFGYLDWRYADHGWFGLYRTISLAVTVALIGYVYRWHRRMVQRLPGPGPADQEEAT